MNNVEENKVSNEKPSSGGKIVAWAFLSLGFLIGNLVGLTASSVVTSLLPMLFAFGGGSAIAFLKKMRSKERKIAACAVMAFSLSCLAGTYLGIITAENRLLSLNNTTKFSNAEMTYELKDIIVEIEKGKIVPEKALKRIQRIFDKSHSTNSTHGGKYPYLKNEKVKGKLSSIKIQLSQDLIDCKQAIKDILNVLTETEDEK